MEENEQERREAIHRFYEVYRPLQKRYNLRMNSHFSIYPKDDDYIEIYEYNGDTKGERICKAKEENEIDCYRKALEGLKSYERKKDKEQEHEKRAG